METIAGRLVRLRPVTPADVPRLKEILSDPAVVRWWGEQEDDLHDVVEPAADEASYAIELLADGTTIGLIQSSEEPTPAYRHAGIDIAIHSDFHGRGYGTDAVAALARHLIDVRGHHRLTIDPALANERAIAVYRRVGFRPVGVMRRYERAPDGTWRDGLLMDLLAEELAPPRG